MPQQYTLSKAAPTRAAFSFFQKRGIALSADKRNAKKTRFISEWLLAASRAEIEKAVDAVQRTRSDMWFRRMFHLWCVGGASRGSLDKKRTFETLPVQDVYALIRRALRAKSYQGKNRNPTGEDGVQSGRGDGFHIEEKSQNAEHRHVLSGARRCENELVRRC